MCVIEHLVIFLRDIAHLSTYPHTFLNFYHFDVTVVMHMSVFGIEHAKCVSTRLSSWKFNNEEVKELSTVMAGSSVKPKHLLVQITDRRWQFPDK